VVLSGLNFQLGASDFAVTFSNPCVHVQNVALLNPLDMKTLVVTVSVDPGCLAGFSTVTVTQNGETTTFEDGLAVRSAPAITSVTTDRTPSASPVLLTRNRLAQTVTIRGTDFQSPPGLVVDFGSTLVTVRSVALQSNGAIVAVVDGGDL